MTAEEIAKLRAARAAFRRKAAGSKFWVKRAKDGNRAKRAARILAAVSDGLSREETAVLLGISHSALRTWLHANAGSTLWPLGSEQLALLRRIAATQ